MSPRRQSRKGSVTQRLARTLSEAQGRYDGDEDDMAFLLSMVRSDEFKALMDVHEVISEWRGSDEAPATRSTSPKTVDAANLLDEARTSLQTAAMAAPAGRGNTAGKLLHILSSPHILSLFVAHDRVAKKDFSPIDDGNRAGTVDSPLSFDTADCGLGRGLNVRLRKAVGQPLGATVKMKNKRVQIGRVLHGSVAHQSGMLFAGDEVIAINDQPVKGRRMEEVVEMVQCANGDVITFQLGENEDTQGARRGTPHAASECRLTVRAMFAYQPNGDHLNPCPEAGLAFNKGDVLNVVSQADPRWWQAKHIDDSGHVRAGLIPGPLEQKRRELIRQQKQLRCAEEATSIRRESSLFRRKSRSRKTSRAYLSTGTEENDCAMEFATYEEVARLVPNLQEPRPVILIGAAGVGCQEIIDRLVSSYRHIYARARPTSTQLLRGSSAFSTAQYQVVPVAQMLEDIANNRFIEYSRVGNNWWGTSIESVKRVQRAGRTCLLNVAPKTVRALRTSSLKPFVVFIAAAPLERLKARLHYRDSRTHRLDEQLTRLCASSAQLEQLYGHYFDYRLVNNDVETTVTELEVALEAMRTQSHWVPAQWLPNELNEMVNN